MLIRIGLLCIPTLDEAAVDAVRRCLQERLAGSMVVQESSARSQRNWVADLLQRWCDEEELDVILTIGGTMPAPGPGNDEIAPEATLAVVERLLPGLPEEMRACVRGKTPLALLDRGVAGIRGRSLILNLPGGAGPVRLFLEAVVDLIEPIVAHLQQRPDAPRLEDVIVIPDAPGEPFPVAVVDESQPLRKTEKFSAEEFAAFLQRKNAV